MSAEDLKRMHDRRAAALQERISEPGIALPTEGEIAARVKQARESGRGLTRYDGEAVMAWWDEEMAQ
jgi:hypothetical protein